MYPLLHIVYVIFCGYFILQNMVYEISRFYFPEGLCEAHSHTAHTMYFAVFYFVNGHWLAKYTKPNPPQNIIIQYLECEFSNKMLSYYSLWTYYGLFPQNPFTAPSSLASRPPPSGAHIPTYTPARSPFPVPPRRISSADGISSRYVFAFRNHFQTWCDIGAWYYSLVPSYKYALYLTRAVTIYQ